jgi:hypothetical protein
MRNLEDKVPLGKYAKAAQAEWAERGRQWPAGYSGSGRVRLCRNLGEDSNKFDFFLNFKDF